MVNKLLSKLMFRELKKNAVSYLAMFFIVLLAVTLFLGFLSNSFTLDKRAELYYEQTNLADLIVQTSTLSTDDKEYLDSLGDAEVEYRVYSDGSFQADGKEPQTAELYLSDGSINTAYITEGEEGFLIDARIAELYEYEVGDTVTVEITSFKSAFSAAGLPYELQFTITGFAHFVDRVNIYSVSAVYITTDTFVSALLSSAGYSEVFAELVKPYISTMQNQALILCDNPSAVKTDIEDYFAASDGGNLLFVYDHDTMESVVTIDSEVEQSLSMIYVFPIIFFVVALLVVMSTISRLILRERTNIGTLKALGIMDAKIIFLYAFLSAFVTLLGCIAGAVLGPLIVPNVMGIKYTLMFSMPQLSGIVVSIPWTILTIAFVCLCAMVIAVWASRSAIKEMPAECMRPRKIEYHSKANNKKSEKTEKANEKEVSHTALSCRMAVRNIRINWGRAIMTVIGVAGCSALLLTSFGIGDTLAQSVDNDLGKAFTYDVSSSCLSANTQSVYGLLEDLMQEGSVSAYETVYTYNVSLSDTGETFTVFVFENNTVMTTTTANGIAISQNKADEQGLSKGDEISFTSDGVKVTYNIEAVVQTSLMNGLFISDSQNAFSDGVYRSESVWIKTDNPDEVKELLNEVNGTLDAQTMDERIAEVNSLISSTNIMKYTLMVFAVLLSVVVLYNLSLLNVKERTRDMATLKVLGYTHFQIALSLVLEIMLLTVIGIAIGCVLGYPLLWLVMTINEISVIAFIITLKPISYVYSVLIAAGTAAIINILFGFKITGIDMTESLKSVE